MTNYLTICPVCSSPIGDQNLIFCPTCDWELMILSPEASPRLKDYYQERLSYHRSSYENQLKVPELQKVKQANEALISEATELNKRLQEADEKHQQLTGQKATLEKQLKGFREQFGEAWIQSMEKRKVLMIKWEIVGPLTFRFNVPSIEEVLPSEIVMLLSASHRPNADGDFDVGLKLDTSARKILDSTSCELSIEVNYLKPGKYYLRFTDLKHETYNILFSHKDQGLAPVFNWDKTLINL